MSVAIHIAAAQWSKNTRHMAVRPLPIAIPATANAHLANMSDILVFIFPVPSAAGQHLDGRCAMKGRTGPQQSHPRGVV